MQWIGLGKITVATAGTPVKISATVIKAHSIIVTYDPSDTGSIFVKDSSGAIVAAMGPNSTAPVILDSGSGQNAIDLSKYSVDTSVNGKGPYVGYSLG